jgi:hypothetical protein
MLAPTLRDCFICHASEDKDAVARPLAEALKEAGYEVWFDEYELVIGDSLRQKIDEGLAASRFGVVVLSHQFFEKGWAQSELNALIAKEMIGSERLILPIWHGVNEEYLASKSPLLADRIAVSSDPIDKAVEQIIRAIEHRRVQGATAAAIVAAQGPSPGPTTPEPVEMVEGSRRVRLRLSDDERAMHRAAENREIGPGWMSVIAGPVRLQPDLIDPTEIDRDVLRDIEIEDAWYHDLPLNRLGLRVDHTGFYRRVPDDEEAAAPYAWFKVWEDGLLEYGQIVANQARFGAGGPPRLVIPTTAIAELIHDHALLFLKILLTVGYEGEAAVVVNFADLEDHELGLDQRYWALGNTQLRTDVLMSRPLRGPIGELPAQVVKWTKKTMDRLFLAGGIASGYFGIDDDGQRLGGQGQVI